MECFYLKLQQLQHKIKCLRDLISGSKFMIKTTRPFVRISADQLVTMS